MLNRVISSWSLAWSRKQFKLELALSIILLITTLSVFSRFVNWVEMRAGVTLADPLLENLISIDVTWLTFALIYVNLIIATGALTAFPERLVLAIQAYVLMLLFRTAAMFIIPLDVPQDMIPLRDPMVEIFGTGKILTRDLFFSGHTATMFILFLCVPQRSIKAILLLSIFLLVVCLLLQHVHYTVDILVAPFFAYGAYRIVFLIHRYIKSDSITS